MGGKSHVCCQCCDFPLISSHRSPSNKLLCNGRHFIDSNGRHQQSQNICQRKESYICSNVSCNLRLCKMCYDSFPVDRKTILKPPEDNLDESEHQNNTRINVETNVENTNESIHLVNEDLEEHENENEAEDESSYTDELLVKSQQDYSLDTTNDNMIYDQGFFSTDVGDNPINTISNNKMIVVSGHVIFNQVGKCTT